MQALIKNDLETVRKCRNKEMSQDEIKYYLADASVQKDMKFDKMDQSEDEYDPDLEGVLY